MEIICSEWVPSEWESKTADKKHHTNPQEIHMIPVNQSILVLWSKSCVFLRNKPILKAIQFKPILYNKASSCEKVYPLLSFHIKIQWYICSELFCTIFLNNALSCRVLSWFRRDSFFESKNMYIGPIF